MLLAEQLKLVADELGDAIQILKVDCEENDVLATELKIEALPTMMLVSARKDQPVLRVEGLHDAE